MGDHVPRLARNTCNISVWISIIQSSTKINIGNPASTVWDYKYELVNGGPNDEKSNRFSNNPILKCNSSTVGSVQPCQGWGRKFEPCLLLKISYMMNG